MVCVGTVGAGVAIATVTATADLSLAAASTLNMSDAGLSSQEGGTNGHGNTLLWTARVPVITAFTGTRNTHDGF